MTKPHKYRHRHIPETRKPVWTTSQKMIGNLIPAFCALPFALFGLWWMSSKGQIMGIGFYVFAASPIAGWIGMNFFGLQSNEEMKQSLKRFMKGLRPKLSASMYFVGIATPSYTSLIDPHEDIGFLILHNDHLEFFGDHLNLWMYKKDVAAFDFRMNPHTLVGLGRWIAIEGIMDGHRVRLQVEPREKKTLMGNLLYSKVLKAKLETWLKEREFRD